MGNSRDILAKKGGSIVLYLFQVDLHPGQMRNCDQGNNTGSKIELIDQLL